MGDRANLTLGAACAGRHIKSEPTERGMGFFLDGVWHDK
jgi:hypothetical protein